MRTVIIPCLAILSMAAACKPTEVGPGASSSQKAKVDQDVVGRAARERGPVVMPPSISGTGSFRCADNSLAIVEFYSDAKSATVRTAEGDSPVRVTSTEAGGTLTAEGGWSLKGAPKDKKVTFSSPKHPKPMSCHV